MEWVKEWAKPAVIIVAIGVVATCQNQRFDSIDGRLDSMDNRLQVIELRTFNMNTRLSRIEGNLRIDALIYKNEELPTDVKE